MPIQTSVLQDPPFGVAGMLADSGHHDILSGIAGGRKLVSVAIVAANNTLYTITLNGVAFSFTSDADGTTAEIAVGLRNAINAGSVPVTASGTDTPLLLLADNGGLDGDFTYADNGSNLTETVVVPAGAAVPNGYGVCIDELVSGGPCDYAVRLPRAAADVTGGKFLGVVVEQFSVEQLPVTVGAAYALAVSPLIPGVLNVLHEGRCYVKVEEAVLAGDAAFCRYAAGGLGLGAWRKSTGTSEAAAVPRAKFLTAAAANGIAILEMVR